MVHVRGWMRDGEGNIELRRVQKWVCLVILPHAPYRALSTTMPVLFGLCSVMHLNWVEGRFGPTSHKV